jgi:DNA-binding CsgD family transcriptional regulator
MGAMWHAEAPDVPRLVCPACASTVAPAAVVGGRVLCTGCFLRLDLTALVGELVALLDASTAGAADVVIDLWLHDLDLSEREREVLGLLLQGFRVGQIAVRTGVSVSTVRKRLRRLLAKTGTRSQAELVARCRARGVGPAPVVPGVVVLVGDAAADQPESPVPSRRSRSPRT